MVAVAIAHHKKTLFSLETRVQHVRDATKDIAGAAVLPFDGLIMDFCAEQNACAVVRGIHNLISKLGGNFGQMVSQSIASALATAQAGREG